MIQRKGSDCAEIISPLRLRARKCYTTGSTNVYPQSGGRAMKAVLCRAYGPPESLVIEEVEPLRAGKGQVVIAVRACGVNFPDALIIQGKYQMQPPMPFSPGSEIAGVVKEVGEGVDG